MQGVFANKSVLSGMDALAGQMLISTVSRISLGLKGPGPFHSWSILNGRYFGKTGLSLGQYVASHSSKREFASLRAGRNVLE